MPRKCKLLSLFLLTLAPRFLPAQSLRVVDETALVRAMQADSTPLLVNFWATWCKPCMEEMPLLIKADSLYKGRVKLLLVSFDMLRDTGRVRRTIAAKALPGEHLLVHSRDMDALINAVDSAWGGALPATWLLAPGRRVAHYADFEQFDDLKRFIEAFLRKPE